MRTLGQQRSEFALREVTSVFDKMKEKKDREDFEAFAAGLPAMILKNGMGHTLAYCLAKGRDKHTKMIELVRRWLSYSNGKDIKNEFVENTRDGKDLVTKLSIMDQQPYFNAQNETLKLLEWVKRYANAFAKGD
ncbi:MAG: type III-B CRISPR module-associated protein Cmr5 [Deltaproteobacteria bacterium]|nr:type III-B CRISPR module-associated protein Cmr5 [Deltaproteobacteria bacterium]